MRKIRNFNYTELQEKDIASYLPYNLQIITDITEEPQNVLYMFNNRFFIDNPSVKDGIYLPDSTPILRRFSDLFMKIIYKDEEIIPIVECAKLATGLPNFFMPEGSKFAEHSLTHKRFYYVNGFIYQDEKILNQVKAFEFMNELKIDYKSLIDDNLARPIK
jgi:hypothetical protein